MITVEYKAINSSKQIVVGTVSEDQLSRLESALMDRGLILINYRLKKQKTYTQLTYTQQQSLWMGLRHYMLSGFTLTDAIKHLGDSAMDIKLSGTLHMIHKQLMQGQMFSQVIQHYLPKEDLLARSLLETAEKTGDYLDILQDLDDYAAWQLAFKRNVQQALRYPNIVFGALWISIFCILYFFAPQLSTYFQHMNQPIPPFTTLLLQLSTWVIQWPWLWIIFPFLMILIIKGLYRLAPGIRGIAIYIPGIKSWILGYYYASISKVIYLQLRHGYSLVDSLKSIEKTYANDWIYPTLHEIRTSVEKGISFASALQSKKRLFSTFFLQLVSVGEATNSLENNLKVIAAFYERDVRQKISAAIKLIEPLMLIFMGILLAVIVGGLFYPMYQQMGLSFGGGL